MVSLTRDGRATPTLISEAALPPAATLAMPVQPLDSRPEPMRTAGRDLVALCFRLVVLGGAAVLAGFFIFEMYAVLSLAGLTGLEVAMLVFFTANIAWIALAFTSAVVGFLVLGAGHRFAGLDIPPDTLPTVRTAILVPTYNEDPARVFGTAAATAEALAARGARSSFDVFVLSDTTDPDIWVAEEVAFRAALSRSATRTRLFYRRRRKNVERKAGNIADWVRRFGGAYPQFIVYDADSLMAPETLIRLAVAMTRHPEAGLIQSVPIIAWRNTLFARLQQFAGRVYGPVIAAGLAAWTRGEGNYWGHNAVIRTRAFAGAAGLPHLSGRPPFGGHILSHDFVEAALLRRAGWKVLITPTLGGSWEESPPSLAELAIRDRRWCQGNLQHAKVIGARGLHWVSRMHFGIGIMSYVASPLWFGLLVAGFILALQAHFIRPEYFTEDFQLFPTWPVIDYQRAIGLFVATMMMLFAPKLLGLVYAMVDRELRRGTGGPIRATFSVVFEALVSALLAPILMVIQTTAVVDILLGRDSGWNPQRRDDGTIPLSAIVRRHRWHTALGLALALGAWLVSPELLLWMSPAIIGLVLSIPLAAWTASQGAGRAARRLGLLSIPEEVEEPEIAREAREAEAYVSRALEGPRDAFLRLAGDPALFAFHRSNLSTAPRLSVGDVDIALVVGLARLQAAKTLEEASGYMSTGERLAVLADAGGLEQLARLPREKTERPDPSPASA